jgi:integrase
MARYPGVTRIAPGLYRVRAKWRCPKTGHVRELVRIVEAESAAEAASKREALKATERQALDPPPRVRVGDCVTSWLTSKLGELKASTARHYGHTLDHYVLPKLGEIWLDKLTHDDVVKWRDAEEGSPVTVNGRLRVLKTALVEVCAVRGIPNPAAAVKTLREPKSEKRRALTSLELAGILDGIQSGSPQWYPLVLALATTGARFGEVTALKWTDLDEAAGTIRIARAQWNGIVDTTKTDIVRTVPLAPELAAELRVHRERLQARLGVGPLPQWVFPSERWTLPRNTVLRKPLAKAAEAAGLGARVPSNHWFRHTFNDLLRQTVSGQVTRSITGHVEEDMTEHYSHVTFEEKKAAVGHVLYLVGGGRGGGASTEKRKAG